MNRMVVLYIDYVNISIFFFISQIILFECLSRLGLSKTPRIEAAGCLKVIGGLEETTSELIILHHKEFRRYVSSNPWLVSQKGTIPRGQQRTNEPIVGKRVHFPNHVVHVHESLPYKSTVVEFRRIPPICNILIGK